MILNAYLLFFTYLLVLLSIKMPIHDYIINIYEHVRDRLYVVRFCEYCISKYFKSTDIYIKNIRFRQLISGIIEDKKGEQYESYAEVYNSLCNTGKFKEYDTDIFNHIYITNDCTLARVLSRITEDEILEFIDKKYRIFCLFRDIKYRIKETTGDNLNNIYSIKLKWNDKKYTVDIHTILSDSGKHDMDLLESYETSIITNLHYIINNKEILIC